MTLANATFLVVLVLFVAALAAFVCREVIHQRATQPPPPWLTWAAWSLAAVWAVTVIWRFEVLG
jgi:hypothetical protein